MLITNIPVTAVYNLRADETLASLNDSKSPHIKVIDSEQELMRHLCMQTAQSMDQSSEEIYRQVQALVEQYHSLCKDGRFTMAAEIRSQIENLILNSFPEAPLSIQIENYLPNDPTDN
ncbi:unnamed protein product [Adineta steineri]|uniref:Uncharacterized protein n=1 Tax=Adineta steineri TaxID=433720 RepID=A0A814AVQ2_9BILA|nr:unnamed protein product [Adineta steineri]CAF0919108.1 unnamed protein product [Adineta steineri]